MRRFVMVLALLATATQAGGLTLNPGDILVGGGPQAAPPAPGVVRVDPSSGATTPVALDLAGIPGGVALEASGDILLSLWLCVSPLCPAVDHALARIDPVAGTHTILSYSGFLAPGGVAIEAGGIIVVADGGFFGGTGGQVLRVDPVTGAKTVVSSGGLVEGATDVAVAAGGQLFVSSYWGIVRVDPTSGAQTLVNADHTGGLAFEAGGDLLVTSYDAIGNPGVFRIDPTSGTATPISMGGLLVVPIGIAVEASGDLLVVDNADFFATGFLVRIDLATGGQTLVTAGGNVARGTWVSVVPASVLVVDPADDPVAVPVLGGLGVAGGFEVTCDATQGGPLTAEYETQTPQERSDCVAAGNCPPVNFAVPGTETQQWQIDFAGSFAGLATLVFRYSQALLGAFPEPRLAVYHFVKGAWKRLPTVIDAATDRLTVQVPEADGFSPFVIGVLPACQDGEDNDGDTFVDFADSGCTDAEDRSELRDCQDGLNNDADGLVDYPADPGCTGPSDPLETNSARACDDGVDNDSDEKIDYPADPGCGSLLGTSENPPAFGGGGCGFTGLEAFALVGAVRWLTKRRTRQQPSGIPIDSSSYLT